MQRARLLAGFGVTAEDVRMFSFLRSMWVDKGVDSQGSTGRRVSK